MGRFFVLCLMCVMLVLSTANADDGFPVVVEAEVRAVLSIQQAGALNNMKTNVGDYVKKKELLAKVYYYDLALEKKQRKVSAAYYAKQVANLTKLNSKGLATNEELEKAMMDKDMNDIQVRIIQTRISKSILTAPFSGFIVARHAQPYEWVNSGQPVFEMYDPRKLRIVASIPSKTAVHFKPGRVDNFYFPDMEKTVQGKLKLIVQEVDVRSNTIKIYWQVNVKKYKWLLPGMRGGLRLGSN